MILAAAAAEGGCGSGVAEQLYAALLRLELLQRGVLVAPDAGSGGGDSKLWTALQTHAGKTLQQPQGEGGGPTMTDAQAAGRGIERRGGTARGETGEPSSAAADDEE